MHVFLFDTCIVLIAIVCIEYTYINMYFRVMEKMKLLRVRGTE